MKNLKKKEEETKSINIFNRLQKQSQKCKDESIFQHVQSGGCTAC